jgi:2-polyprenyl-3-methyl-5-hydroxy-6-metoxy-1,4-benzoquinol methylase
MMESMSFGEVRIERVRDYWNARPCNLRHSTQPVGTRQYFDEVEARKYMVEPHIPGFAEFEKWSGKKVLEIGCGLGTDTVNFARADAQVTSVDLSEKSLELAKQRIAVYGFQDRVKFHQANAEELSNTVPPEPYDLIYSFGVIHHTPHPERVLEQLRKYAKPGTTLKVMVYYRYAYKVAWILLSEGRGQFWKLEELVAKNSEAQTGCPVTYTYSKSQGRKLVENAGFRLKEARVEHIFPYRIADYVQYRYVKEPYFRWMPDAMFHALERRFGWHLCITAVAE